MGDIAIIMPVIAAIGAVIITVVVLIVKGMLKKEVLKGIDTEKFNQFAQEIKKENSEMKKEIIAVKDKVEAIDKMLKDI